MMYSIYISIEIQIETMPTCAGMQITFDCCWNGLAKSHMDWQTSYRHIHRDKWTQYEVTGKNMVSSSCYILGTT